MNKKILGRLTTHKKEKIDALGYIKEKTISSISSIPLKEKLLAAATTIPFIAATSMSGACATGCPYGMVDCPYPGQCPRYVDVNGDGLCDLSQSTTTTDTSTTATSTEDTSTTTPDDIATSNTDQGHGNGANSDPAISQPDADVNTSLAPDSGFDAGSVSGDGTNYYVIPISLIIIGGYLFTYYLFKRGILKQHKHRRIWNLLVTLGYVGTGVTGVILTLMVNLGIKTALNQPITYWHVELAILMVVGTLVHIHIYWRPFKNMFKVLFGFKTNSKKNSSESIAESFKGTSK